MPSIDFEGLKFMTELEPWGITVDDRRFSQLLNAVIGVQIVGGSNGQLRDFKELKESNLKEGIAEVEKLLELPKEKEKNATPWVDDDYEAQVKAGQDLMLEMSKRYQQPIR